MRQVAGTAEIPWRINCYWTAIQEYHQATRDGDGETARLALAEIECLAMHDHDAWYRAICHRTLDTYDPGWRTREDHGPLYI